MKLTNLTQQFELMKIALDLETYINSHNKTSLGEAIMNHFKEKKPIAPLLKEIQSQGTDNPNMIEKCIGKELNQRICNIKF